MVLFDKDENLGPTVSQKNVMSFGAKKMDDFSELVFAAGGSKFSNLCGFRFVSKAPTQYKEFFICFVCKLRSKIYKQAANPSQWFIFKRISPVELHCLSKKDLLDQYGFDIKKFYDSDYFAKWLPKMKATVNKGLDEYVPEFIKQHGQEKAMANLTSYDGNPNDTIEGCYKRYVDSIRDGLKYIDSKRTNDKFYKLVNYGTTAGQKAKPADESKIVESSQKAIITLGDLKKALKPYKFSAVDDKLRVVLANDVGDKYVISEIGIVPADDGEDILAFDLADEDSVNESADNDIIKEGQFECEVEEKDGKFEVYEKDNHIWVATFYSKLPADQFAAQWPKLKQQYLKQECDSKMRLAEKKASEEAEMEKVAEQKAAEEADNELLDSEIEEALSEIYN